MTTIQVPDDCPARAKQRELCAANEDDHMSVYHVALMLELVRTAHQLGVPRDVVTAFLELTYDNELEDLTDAVSQQ